MENTTTIVKKRLFWLDFARTIAIISITFNHALSRSFNTESDMYSEYLQMPIIASFFKALMYVFSRIGVPLFLMISGTLLISRDYENKDITERFLKKNCLPLLRTTLIWITIMFWYLQISEDSILNTEGVVSAILHFLESLLFINQTTMGSMWYMPMILCIYLMIPVISIGMRKLGNKFFILLYCIVLIKYIVVPNINITLKVLGIEYTLSLPNDGTEIFSIYFLYVIMGFWICNGMMKKFKNVTVFLCFALSFFLTAVFQFLVYSHNVEYHVRYADLGILVMSSFLFELTRRIKDIRIIKKPITYISRISFAIYFLHICIMTGVNFILDKYLDIIFFKRFFILESTSLIGSVLIICITAKYNFFKKYLYLIK